MADESLFTLLEKKKQLAENVNALNSKNEGRKEYLTISEDGVKITSLDEEQEALTSVEKLVEEILEA